MKFEDFESLGFHMGDPVRIKHDLKHPSKQEDFREEPVSRISKEEEERFIRQMLDQHYQEWLDTPSSFFKSQDTKAGCENEERSANCHWPLKGSGKCRKSSCKARE